MGRMKLSASPVLEEYGYFGSCAKRLLSVHPTPPLSKAAAGGWRAGGDARETEVHGGAGGRQVWWGRTPALLRPGLLLGVGLVPQDSVDFLDDLRGQLGEDLSEEEEGRGLSA